MCDYSLFPKCDKALLHTETTMAHLNIHVLLQSHPINKGVDIKSTKIQEKLGFANVSCRQLLWWIQNLVDRSDLNAVWYGTFSILHMM
jgi:hypothetical protein